MRAQLTLGLCWLVMLGNAYVVLFAPSALIHDPVLRDFIPPILTLAMLSFWCALVLRRRIVKSIRESMLADRKPASTHVTRPPNSAHK